METKPAREAPAASTLDPGVRETLPPLVVGDEGVETTWKHEWPGRLFIVLSGITALGLAGSAVAGAVLGLNGDVNLPLSVGIGVWAVLQWRLTKEVSRFSRWGWYGAMAELGGAAAAEVWAMAEGDFVGGAIALVPGLLWMRYFWARRDQFDVDLGG
ncbi:MAG TPA: hypothetical protein VFR37_12320 [Longimicrobium sp.]|nr:hypothetical protein [Longimicrobium sp.]